MKSDRVSAILNLILGSFLIWQGIKLPPGKEGAPGAGFFPVWIGAGMILLSSVLFLRPQGAQMFGSLLPRGDEARRVGLVLSALILYAAVLKPVGFVIATFLLFLVLLQFYQRGRWWTAAALSLAAVLGSYWLFAGVFDMPLPPGLLTF